MEGKLGKGLTRVEEQRQKVLTFPTNKFLLAVAVGGREAKKSSGFVGIVGIDWGGRQGYKGPAVSTTRSMMRYCAPRGEFEYLENESLQEKRDWN